MLYKKITHGCVIQTFNEKGNFVEQEFIAGIDTFLDGWLALGENGIRFENKFSPRLGKEFGALTNSGSSANLLMVTALSSRKLFNLPKGSKINCRFN